MKIIKWFLISNIFLNFLLLNSPAISKDLSVPPSIQFKLSNSEYNKYITRSMRAYTDGEIYGQSNIKKKYKKWVKAKILLDNKIVESEIRILGDWKDHLRPPLTSLKVKIIKDSFYGVTRFNLFLPETRKGENEVFWTLMLNYLSIPSLHTRMVEVDLNGNIYRAIFQEDATKEFLERNNLTETVILKANDFDFYLNSEEEKIYDNFFSHSYLIDNNNFLKNDVANFIASEAIALKSNIKFQDQVINEIFFKSIMKKYAHHGLSMENRKYIYIPYKKIFLPLYYDGNVQFLPGRTKCNKKINDQIISNFKKDFKYLTNKNLSKMQECVFKDIFYLSKNSLKKQGDFFNEKLDNEKSASYTEIKNLILNYLNQNNQKKLIKNNLEEKQIIYTFIYNDKYFHCFLSTKSKKIKFCEQIDSLKYSKYISESGRFKNFDNFKSFPINLGIFNNEIPIINLSDKHSEYYLDKNATYYFVKKNKSNQDIKFFFKNPKSRLFIQGKFKNVNFNFKREFMNEEVLFNGVRYDKNLLTGCANFFDSDFDNVSIKSLDMACEDSVNIKSSSGNLNNIEINNSSYDALDLDFSEILIKNINVKNANNDCLDFSFGEYRILSANLTNCTDKGISVGENSKLNLNNGFISNSKIGVASKDDALTEINTIKIEDIDICLAAYNKKKEFKGSKINVKNFTCNRYETKLQSDNLSEIIISKEN
jgi:hypothetical protein